MLVLSRKTNEQVIIGDDVTITVIDVRGDRVRIGITAPRELAVHRREVAERIREGRGSAKGQESSDESQEPEGGEGRGSKVEGRKISPRKTRSHERD